MNNILTNIKIKSVDYQEDLKELKVHGQTQGSFPRKFDGIFLRDFSTDATHGVVEECEVLQDDSFVLTIECGEEEIYWEDIVERLLLEGEVEAFCGLSIEAFYDLSTQERREYLVKLIENITTGRVQNFAKKHLSLATKLRPIVDSEPTGFSKFGGLPDCPKDFVYPKNDKGISQLFLFQLDLGELSNELESSQQIGDQGFIYVFAALNDSETYPEIENLSFHFVPQNYDLQPVDLPDDLKDFGAYPEMDLMLVDEWNLPPNDTSLWQGDEMTRKEEEEYGYLVSILNSYNGMQGIKLLGHPDQIQGCVLLEAVLKQQQQAWYNPKGFDQSDFETIIEKLKPLTTHWQMLLELDADENFMKNLPKFKGHFNEYIDGKFFLMIKKEALNILDFSKLMMIHQST